LSNSGESRIGETRKPDFIKADDGNVLRNMYAPLLEPLYGSKGDQIVRSKNCVDGLSFLQKYVNGLISFLEREVYLNDEAWVHLKTIFLETFPVTL